MQAQQAACASGALTALAAQTPHGLAGLTRIWGHLPAFLRTGEAMHRSDGSLAERQTVYADAVAALGRMFASSAEELAKVLAVDLAGGVRRSVLDVGAGSGVWSLALAEVVPELRVTALDLPPVLEVFGERAKALGVSDRVSTVAQSFHEPFGEGAYDLVFLAGILHLEAAESAAALIRRAARVLAPGGRIVTVDALGGEGPEELARSLYALHLAMRTEGGVPHREEVLRAWLREAGARAIETVPLSMPGLGALVASFGA